MLLQSCMQLEGQRMVFCISLLLRMSEFMYRDLPCCFNNYSIDVNVQMAG